MTNSISSISAAASATNAQTSVQKLSDQTKMQLEAMGIDTSGITTEAQGQALLQTAAAQTGQQGQGGEQSKEPPAWSSSMETLGLTPTGTEDGDIAAVNAIINSLDYEDGAMVAETFQALGLSVEAPEDPQMTSGIGQEQLAKLNKYSMVG